MELRRHPPAISPVIGAILLIGMTVVLSTLVYLMVAAAPQPGIDPSKFQYIRIMEVRILGYHTEDTSPPGCDDSCILLIHDGTGPLRNDRISAVVLGNDRTLKANITTLNAGQFPKTKHYGAEHVSGPGSTGSMTSTWDPGEEIYLDLNEKSIHTGDLVTVRIIDKDTNLVISEDTARA
jgi:flagellin-like protein